MKTGDRWEYLAMALLAFLIGALTAGGS